MGVIKELSVSLGTMEDMGDQTQESPVDDISRRPRVDGNGSGLPETQKSGKVYQEPLGKREVRRMPAVVLDETETQEVEDFMPGVLELGPVERAREATGRAIDRLFESLPGEFGRSVEVRDELKERLVGDFDDLGEIYARGGEIGDEKYQGLDRNVMAHNFDHVAIQVALMADVATHLATKNDREDLPENAQGEREFGLREWLSMWYGALFHETGYLLTKDEAEEMRESDEYPTVSGLFYADKHEERGIEFAEKTIGAWGLEGIVEVGEENMGIDKEQIRDNIWGTKLAAREPTSMKRWKDVSLADLSHVVDLAAYAVDEEYVPWGISNLQVEMGFSSGGDPTEIAQTSQAVFVNSGFMRVDSYWGSQVGDLMELFGKEGGDEASDWVDRYEATLRGLKLYGKVVEMPKNHDSVQFEGSLEPWRLWKLALDFGVVGVYKDQVAGLMKKKTTVEMNVLNRMPTGLLRELYWAVDEERRVEFLKEAMLGEMWEAAEQNVENVEIMVSPMALVGAAGEIRGVGGSEVEESVAAVAEAFERAREKFESGGSERAVDLSITLRREDGDENYKVIKALMEREIGLRAVVVAGSDSLERWDGERTAKLIRRIKGMPDRVEVGLIYGQTNPGERRFDAEYWRAVTRVMGKGDRLVFANEVIESEEFRLAFLGSELELELSVDDVLGRRGFNAREVVELLKEPGDRVRVTSSNNALLGNIATQLYGLLEVGMSMEELKRLVGRRVELRGELFEQEARVPAGVAGD